MLLTYFCTLRLCCIALTHVIVMRQSHKTMYSLTLLVTWKSNRITVTPYFSRVTVHHWLTKCHWKESAGLVMLTNDKINSICSKAYQAGVSISFHADKRQKVLCWGFRDTAQLSFAQLCKNSVSSLKITVKMEAKVTKTMKRQKNVSGILPVKAKLSYHYFS